LDILRELVELQLGHSQEVKAAIDRAWGIVHNKHKKGTSVPAFSCSTREELDFLPFGMDHKRERYWIVDGLWTSELFISAPSSRESHGPFDLTAITI